MGIVACGVRGSSATGGSDSAYAQARTATWGFAADVLAVLLAAIEVHFDWATPIEINVSIVSASSSTFLSFSSRRCSCIALTATILAWSKQAIISNVIAESPQVSIREAVGWSAQTPAATPKTLALTGFARAGATRRVQIRRPAAVAGPAQLARGWAKRLQGRLAVSILITGGGAPTELPQARNYPIYSGKLERIGVRSRRSAGRIRSILIVARIIADASPRAVRTELHFLMHQPPQGYWRPGRDASAQADAVT